MVWHIGPRRDGVVAVCWGRAAMNEDWEVTVYSDLESYWVITTSGKLQKQQ